MWQRKLSVGHTLKKTDSGGYVVDLTAERRSHKTSRFYGPRWKFVRDVFFSGERL